MSVQAALEFFQHLRDGHVDVPGPLFEPIADSLDEVVQAGRMMGYEFNEDDLRAAFRHDWARRWLILGTVKEA